MRRIRSLERFLTPYRSCRDLSGIDESDIDEPEIVSRQALIDCPSADGAGQSCCGCESAVRMAYWNMIHSGHGHFRAFRVADRVFRWHLPTVSDDVRETRIIGWVQSGPPH